MSEQLNCPLFATVWQQPVAITLMGGCVCVYFKGSMIILSALFRVMAVRGWRRKWLFFLSCVPRKLRYPSSHTNQPLNNDVRDLGVGRGRGFVRGKTASSLERHKSQSFDRMTAVFAYPLGRARVEISESSFQLKFFSLPLIEL